MGTPSKAPLAEGMQHAVDGVVNQLLKKHNHRSCYILNNCVCAVDFGGVQANHCVIFAGDWTFYETVMGFVSAVDWTEKWIIGVVTMHVCFLLSVVCFRKVGINKVLISRGNCNLSYPPSPEHLHSQNINFQTVLFVMMCGIIFFSERLNRFV